MNHHLPTTAQGIAIPSFLESLSPAEYKTYQALKGVRKDTLWGAVIKGSLEKRSREHLQKLITTLISQGRDNPEVMKRILGEQAYEAVMAQAGE